MRCLLIIGVDAGTLDLIEPWARAGDLPHLARLLKEGAYGRVRSTLPPSTYPAWTSFMTGQNPGRHGLVDFTLREGGRYAVRFASSRDRQSSSLWGILSEAGRRVAVVGMPATYPPEAVQRLYGQRIRLPPGLASQREFFSSSRALPGGHQGGGTLPPLGLPGGSDRKGAGTSGPIKRS